MGGQRTVRLYYLDKHTRPKNLQDANKTFIYTYHKRVDIPFDTNGNPGTVSPFTRLDWQLYGVTHQDRPDDDADPENGDLLSYFHNSGTTPRGLRTFYPVWRPNGTGGHDFIGYATFYLQRVDTSTTPNIGLYVAVSADGLTNWQVTQLKSDFETYGEFLNDPPQVPPVVPSVPPVDSQWPQYRRYDTDRAFVAQDDSVYASCDAYGNIILDNTNSAKLLFVYSRQDVFAKGFAIGRGWGYHTSANDSIRGERLYDILTEVGDGSSDTVLMDLIGDLATGEETDHAIDSLIHTLLPNNALRSDWQTRWIPAVKAWDAGDSSKQADAELTMDGLRWHFENDGDIRWFRGAPSLWGFQATLTVTP